MIARASSYPVLLVDDEVQFLQSAAITLRVAGFDVTVCSNSREVVALAAEREFGAIMLDILMPGLSGTALLPELKRTAPHSQVIMVTAVTDVETAVACMRQGAFDYLVKPVEKDRLVTTVRRAIDMVELNHENISLRDHLLRNQLEHPETFEPIVTRDRSMIAIFQYIEAIAQTRMPVLVKGETGTGKELVAQAIHRASGRKGEFVSVNASGLGDALFCDTLFGHERGAFTSADGRREGLVAKAAGGTMFLDEIGDLALETQVKLLRLLEERTYYAMGSDTQRITDARFVVATNCDLASLQKEGRFRSDLYYRLEAHNIELPPLRARRNDLPLLIDCFVEVAAQQLGKNPPSVPASVYPALESHPFPGNVRELRNMIFDAVSVCAGPALDETYFFDRLQKNLAFSSQQHPPGDFSREALSRLSSLPSLKEAEQMLIEEALQRSNGNQTMAASFLGMTRSALNKRLTRAKGDGSGDLPSDS
ncbi:MAG: sigma-54-dependent Fis family transcriptional regulator [Chitinispirillaceae bacterium]|nr:sigma-54-dependent Fis family transcriptional regulator [Chitinispirillaceae bacterium]